MGEGTHPAAGVAVLAAGVTLSAEATLVQGLRRVLPRAVLLPILQFLLAELIEESIAELIVPALVGGCGATA